MYTVCTIWSLKVMPLLSPAERHFVQAVGDLSYCNPFLPERTELERVALGDAFETSSSVWSRDAASQEERSNVARINERGEALAAEVRQRLENGQRAGTEEWKLYEELVEYLLYQRYRQALSALAEESLRSPAKTRPVRFWKQFL